MRKYILIQLLGLIFILQINLTAQPSSPQRLEILGAIVGGAELINGVVKIIISHKSKENVGNITNEIVTNSSSSTNTLEENNANKEEELKKLLAPSKLFDMINASTNRNQISTNKSLPLNTLSSNTGNKMPLTINNTNKIINFPLHTNQNLTNLRSSGGTNNNPNRASPNKTGP